jgi:hypothetical protein
LIYLITKLPTTPSGNNAIVTIIDHLTKRAHFIPTTEEDISTEAIARLFLKESVRLHGMPTKIVSDRDPRFKKDTSDREHTHHPPAMVHTARGSEYMIEKIVVREKQGNRWMYKVRWTGYEEKDDTWQPLTGLDGCKETVEEFHREKGLTPPRWPRRIRGKL